MEVCYLFLSPMKEPEILFKILQAIECTVAELTLLLFKPEKFHQMPARSFQTSRFCAARAKGTARCSPVVRVFARIAGYHRETETADKVCKVF